MISSSGAGKALSCRRRDTNHHLFNCSKPLLNFLRLAKVYSLLESSRTLSNHMPLIGDSPSNKGQRAWLAIFLSQSVLAAAMLEAEPKMEKPSKADDDTQQSRSRSSSSSTREEPSHQASLMAGIRILGPSDVPCLVETSTAHGDLLFSVIISSIGMIKLLESFSYISDLVQDSQISPLPSPKLSESPENLPTKPYGRRLAQICLLPTKEKLGFQLVGSSKAGPISLLKPKYKRCNPKHNMLKPRSVIKSFCRSLAALCRLLEKIDRRHQLKQQSPLLLWMYKNSLRTMLLDSSRISSHEPKSLKKNGSMVSSLQISWNNNEDPYNLNRDTEPLPHALKQKPPIVRTIISVLLADVFLCLAPLGSATNSALDSSTTSSSLLTVTITSSNASLVDEPSTNRVITCAKVSPNFWLQALMEILLNFAIYLFVATLLCLALNSENLVALYPLILVLI